MGMLRLFASLFEYSSDQSLLKLASREVWQWVETLQQHKVFERNTTIRKLVVKVVARIGRFQVRSGGPELIEPIIDMLLTCLTDRDTVVRWSSSKSLATLTSTLPSEMKHEITEAVLALMNEQLQYCSYDYNVVSDQVWHGCILSLSELARRRLIDDTQLPPVLDLVIKVSWIPSKYLTYVGPFV
jgi:hypothetical protein